jgi:hypothetical protein
VILQISGASGISVRWVRVGWSGVACPFSGLADAWSRCLVTQTGLPVSHPSRSPVRDDGDVVAGVDRGVPHVCARRVRVRVFVRVGGVTVRYDGVRPARPNDPRPRVNQARGSRVN